MNAILHWRDEAFVEQNRAIFEREFESFLPPRILDAHAHVFPAGTFPEDAPYVSGGVPAPQFTFDDLCRDYATILPGRDVSVVTFGSPRPTIDWQGNNNYVAAHARAHACYPFRLVSPEVDTPDDLAMVMKSGQFLGFKPYYTFVEKEDPQQVELIEMLPPWMMEIADRLGLLITLHLPRAERFADPLNQEQLESLARQYPNAIFLVAHAGRAYYYKNIVGSLDRFARLPNVYLEFSMVQNWEVIAYCFRRFPLDRIIFGSDAPIAFAPGASVEINDQYTYITPNPWSIAVHDSKPRIRYTSFLYEELRAIKKAVRHAALGDTAVENLFCNTARKLLCEVSA